MKRGREACTFLRPLCLLSFTACLHKGLASARRLNVLTEQLRAHCFSSDHEIVLHHKKEADCPLIEVHF